MALPSHRLEDGQQGQEWNRGPREEAVARSSVGGDGVGEREARLLCALTVELTGFAEKWKGG